MRVVVLLSCKGAVTAGKYTIVAQVIDGMDVLDKMEKIKVGKLNCRLLLVIVVQISTCASALGLTKPATLQSMHAAV